MSWTHFEQMAEGYAAARPPYPDELFDLLTQEGVIGPGLRVLEVGAGAGLATGPLIASGSEVVALEPGHALADLLRLAVPGASVVVERVEDAELLGSSFDSVVAATALHWVDLSVALPRLHHALRPEGTLAVFRHVFGDGSARPTPFRRRVREITERRQPEPGVVGTEARPTVPELTAGGWFHPIRTERWRWSVELTSEQVAALFSTFSNWSPGEVEAVREAANDLGGSVVEHYQTVLHLLRRVGPSRDVIKSGDPSHQS